jgi:peptidoglycan/xylan/chitin deacetylase (PgdA/CDA1 family)
MPSKKEMLAKFASYSGVTRVLESFPGRSSLLILNYHRIGDPALTPYDSGTFSCSAEELDWQVRWLKQRFPILNLHQAVDIVHGRTKPAQTSILITFDDGYLDNYVEAFPVFRSHNVSATFFLPTLFVGTHTLPWWDEIAYMIKRTTVSRLAITYPDPVEVDLTGSDREAAVVAVLRVFKKHGAIDTSRFLSELEAATQVQRPGEHSERCFLNWDEAREMQAAGMCFGSHTHSHEILARLPYERQVEELRTSRHILEQQLGGSIETLAYPRGKAGSFSQLTFDALRETNYTTAFSFYSGVNKPGTINPLDVLREAVEIESRNIFRLRHATCATMGRGLV